jgi:hypothetical protein
MVTTVDGLPVPIPARPGETGASGYGTVVVNASSGDGARPTVDTVDTVDTVVPAPGATLVAVAGNGPVVLGGGLAVPGPDGTYYMSDCIHEDGPPPTFALPDPAAAPTIVPAPAEAPDTVVLGTTVGS